jgi:soluble cytochrome b562
MDAELKAYLEGMESRLVRRIDEARQHTEETETKLLREFWKWARTADARSITGT